MMIEALGERRCDVLKPLLKKKEGLPTDAIAAELGLSRPGIRHDGSHASASRTTRKDIPK